MGKHCEECPWHKETEHNKKFRSWFHKLTKMGFIRGKHRCHMKDAKNIWVEPTRDTICVGKKRN